MSAVRVSLLMSLLLGACTSGDTTVAEQDDGSVDGAVAADTGAPGDSRTLQDAPDSNDAADAPDATDTAAADDATDGDTAPAPTCTDPTTFPTFGKGCTLDAHCSYGLHQLDCCGSLGAIGINHAFTDDFNATEDAYRKTCPVCDCLAMDTRTESGVSTNDTTRIAVRCDVGLCKTYVK